jgi:hypothetical protein
MKKLILGCFVVGGTVAFAACSSTSPCQTFINAETTLGTAAAPCAVATDGGTPVSTTSVTNCETAYSSASCTSADQTELTTLANNYSTCASGVAACTTATAAMFGMAEEACLAPIVAAAGTPGVGDAGGTAGAISAACVAAISPTIGL